MHSLTLAMRQFGLTTITTCLAFKLNLQKYCKFNAERQEQKDRQLSGQRGIETEQHRDKET